MTQSEAQVLLELGEGPPQPEAARAAYLRRVRAVRLDVDPDAFVRLRSAYELLSHGGGAPSNEGTAARKALATQPDSVDARWRLLSYLPYTTSPEAFPIIREGAERSPDDFLDELLFHFPERVPAEILERALEGAGPGRLLLIADVHAVQGRPSNAVELLRSSLSVADLHSVATLKLAARPVFSLHIHAQLDAANEALALLKQRAGQPSLDARNLDWETATIFAIADELGRLGPSFPLDLRQVAALAAKRGNFANAAYEARFATRLLKPREVRKLSEGLNRDAPTLAKTLGLDRNLDQLGASGTPNFRIPVRWGVIITIPVLIVAFKVYRIKQRSREMDQILRSSSDEFIQKSLGDMREQIRTDCIVPDSERCQHWKMFFSGRGQDADGGTVKARREWDGGLTGEDIGTIGRHHDRRPRDVIP